MDNSNKISIIVPVYNSEKSLKRCVDSIINQTYRNLEILLINDGSTDGSLKICNDFAISDNRVKLVNKKNGGVSSARNIGLDIATGDYYGFVDSDDYVVSNMYEKLMDAILITGADIAECGYNRVSHEGQVIKSYPLLEDYVTGIENCLTRYLKKENTTNFMWNKVYKKSLFQTARFSNLRYSEDYVLNTNVHCYCKSKVTIKSCCYYYVDSQSSATNMCYSRRKLDVLYAADEARIFIKDKFPELEFYTNIYMLFGIITISNQMKESKISVDDCDFVNIIKKYDVVYELVKKDSLLSSISNKTLFHLKLFKFSPSLYNYVSRIKKYLV